MTGETTIGDRAADDVRRRADLHHGIESALAELRQIPANSAEARALREQLIGRSLPLAEHIARRYSGNGETYDELFQAASRALTLAIERFDPTRGEKFVAFAVPTVLGAVRRCVREPAFAMNLTQRVQEFQAIVRPTVDAMTHRLARVPTAREIAVQLEVDLLEVTRALLAGHGRRVCATAPNITGEVVYDSGYDMIMQKSVAFPPSAVLSEAERWVVYQRFFRNLPQTQIAEQLGISPMQVSRILADALDRIRESAL